MVSVPSRGLSYLNEILSMMDETGEVVSVPSRGLSYLNSSSCWLSSSSFSSFRPLTGTLLSKHSFLMNPVEVRGQVSVPSRGLSYLNINPNIFYSDFSQSGFRPLTGTLLSKRKGYKNKSYQIIRVSVPSRGLSYLNEQRFPLFTGLNFVSVPSRGLSYLNENYLTVEEVIACFRPLTGTLLSKQVKTDFGTVKLKFPSPHGDSLI